MSTLEKIRAILVQSLGVTPDAVAPESRIVEDLGADSLDKVEIIMAVEDEFNNIDIPDEDAEKIKTVQQLIDYIDASDD